MNNLNNSKTYIIGAGGFGREVRSMLSNAQGSFAGFLDDNTEVDGVVMPIDNLANSDFQSNNSFLVAFGSSITRRKIVNRIKASLDFPVLVHETTLLQAPDTIKFGKGSIICAANIFTCDILLGSFCLINVNCTIGHDVYMGDFCSLMPSVNISGGVTLEDNVFIGTGAIVLPGIRIGKDAIVGAGSVVTKNVVAGTTVIGIPAKTL